MAGGGDSKDSKDGAQAPKIKGKATPDTLK